MAKAETKFTPGPWRARCNVVPCFHIEAGAYHNGTAVCAVAVNPCGEANAHLIAAAPDLYAVVKLVKERRYANFTLAEWHQIDAALSRVEQPQ